MERTHEWAVKGKMEWGGDSQVVIRAHVDGSDRAIEVVVKEATGFRQCFLQLYEGQQLLDALQEALAILT